MTVWAVDPARKRRLASQLTQLAQRGIEDAFKLEGKPPKHPDLSDLVLVVQAEHPEVGDQVSVEALRATIEKVVGGLPPVPLRLVVPGTQVPKKFTERLLGQRMFNLVKYDYDTETWHEGEEDSEWFRGMGGHRYDALVNSIFDLFDLSKGILDVQTRKDCLSELREKIAERLLVMEAKARRRSADRDPSEPASIATEHESPLASASSDETLDVGLERYVPRPAYEQWVLERVYGASLLVLWGDAGTGKTTLAEHFGKSLLGSTSKRITIRCVDQRILEEDLEVYLQNWGVGPEVINPGNKWALFIKLITGPRHPPVAIFDDVQDYSTLDFIPVDSLANIVVTSTIRPHGRFRENAKWVGDLDPDQASEMVRRKYPSASAEEASQLAAVLGNRALAIDAACGFLSTSDIRPRELLTRLRNRLAEELDEPNPKTPGNRVLTAVYRMTIEQLQSSPNALAVLDTFIFMKTTNPVPTDHLAMVWSMDALMDIDTHPAAFAQYYESLRQAGVIHFKRWAMAIPSGDSRIAVERATSHLQRISLLRLGDRGYEMHTLTARLLVELRASYRGATQQRLVGMANDQLVFDEWHGGSPLRLEVARWVMYASAAVVELRPEDVEMTEAMFIARTAYVLAAALQVQRQYTNTYYFPLAEKASNLLADALRYLRNDSDVTFRERRELNESVWTLIASIGDELVLAEYPISRPWETLPYPDGIDTLDAIGSLPVIQQCFLRHDTEWDPIHLSMDAPSLLERVEEHRQLTAVQCTRVTYRDISRIAQMAIWESSCHFQQARWDDAIRSLDLALKAYVKVGGDIECTSGYLSALCRLARVHIRRGDLDVARDVLFRTPSFEEARKTARIDGNFPFSFSNKLEWPRFEQQCAELLFTELVLGNRHGIKSLNAEDSRMLIDSAEDMWRAFRVGGTRFEPELIVFTRRLAKIVPEVTTNLPEYSTSSVKLSTQGGLFQQTLGFFHLLCEMTVALQYRIVGCAGSLLVRIADEDLQSLDKVLPTFEVAVRTVIERFYKVFNVPYWYTRALAVLLMFGILTKKPDVWIRAVRIEFIAAATQVKRADWITWIDEFPENECSRHWLLAY